MNLQPGDVTPQGYILCSDGALLSRGTVYVSLCQALKAYKFGWHIRNAISRRDGKLYMVIRR